MKEETYYCDACGKEVEWADLLVTIQSGYALSENIHKDLCIECSEELLDELSEPAGSVVKGVVDWVKER